MQLIEVCCCSLTTCQARARVGLSNLYVYTHVVRVSSKLGASLGNGHVRFLRCPNGPLPIPNTDLCTLGRPL